MPNISNATVATGTGLSTAGNGGRKLVRLSNGWLVATAYGNSRYNFYADKQDGFGFVPLCHIQFGFSGSISIQSKGTMVYVAISTTSTGYDKVHFKLFDATTVTNIDVGYGNNIDTNQTALGNVSLAINEAGTELHAAWSSKNGNYPNSFNIRYAKGTINGDGSVTWGAVEQWTTTASGSNNINPTIVVKDGLPYVVTDRVGSGTNSLVLFSKSTALNAPTSDFLQRWKVLFDGGSYEQSNPVAQFVPQSVNNLTNGRLWVAWHGKDATDTAKFNVRVSYSDDGGVTWATSVKLTSGNLYDRQNVSLAADKTGKVFALYEEHQWSPDLDIYMRTYNGSWGAPVAVAEADPAAESNPSALVDYSLQMTTPPFVFMSGTDGIKFSGNFNVGASVSPASGSLGDKETPTLTAYTVTPENGSTVTQIVEKLNGVTLNTYNNPASLSRTFTVPQVNWDGITFWYSHTAEIIVTDSNGATTTTTYTFVKALADNAPLLEGVAATEDAYERISDKRDALAAQVGLSAGSTFDAIILATMTNLKKFQVGAVNTDSQGSATFTGLAFQPKMVMMIREGTQNFTITTWSDFETSLGGRTYIIHNNGSSLTSNSLAERTANGFTIKTSVFTSVPMKFIALG